MLNTACKNGVKTLSKSCPKPAIPSVPPSASYADRGPRLARPARLRPPAFLALAASRPPDRLFALLLPTLRVALAVSPAHQSPLAKASPPSRSVVAVA